ncbi:MAG: hypothetical protein JNL82_03345 [Myxococcales bacterium]|nr:hypothetical protein [Myxococcales bacterium]
MLRLALIVGLVVLVAGPAAAHQPGLSRGAYRVDGRRVGVELVLARGEAAKVVPRVDADRDGVVSEIELLQVQDALAAAMGAGVQIEDGAAECAGAVERVTFVEEDGLAFHAAFTCPEGQPLTAVTVRLPLLARLEAGHRHHGQVWFSDASAGSHGAVGPLDFVAARRRPALTIRRPAPAPAAAVEPSPPAPDEAPPAPARWRTWAGLAGLFGLAGLVALRLRERRRRG